MSNSRTSCRMKCVSVVLLILLSCGHSVPLSDCETLVKPITPSKEDMLGSWLYIGGSSNIPGSRSLGHLLTNVWMNISAVPQTNILNFIQTHRTYFQCASLSFNVTFENGTMLIEQPFYLKDIFLTTDCEDCLVVYEEIISGKDKFTGLFLFSRRQTVSPSVLEMLRKQAECLQMPSPIMTDPNSEKCPIDDLLSDGLSDYNALLESKMGQKFARVLDTFFDIFVN